MEVNRLTDVVNGVSTLDRIGCLIGQDGLQKVPSDGGIGIQERWPCSVNYIDRVRELRENLSAPSQEPK